MKFAEKMKEEKGLSTAAIIILVVVLILIVIVGVYGLMSVIKTIKKGTDKEGKAYDGISSASQSVSAVVYIDENVLNA